MGQTRLILASRSPRRRELLSLLGIDFEMEEAAADERRLPNEPPSEYVGRLARTKAQVVAQRHPGAVILGADTTVTIDGEVLGKPANPSEGAAMLKTLSGRPHQVLTGICVRAAREFWDVVTTTVCFRAAPPEELDWYASLEEPRDKAGGYAIQGTGSMFIDSIQGSPSNVIGLPLAQTIGLLKQAGVAFPWENAS